MSSGGNVFQVTINVNYTDARRMTLRRLEHEHFVNAVRNDLTLFGISHPKKENIVWNSTELYLTYTSTERTRTLVCVRGSYRVHACL